MPNILIEPSYYTADDINSYITSNRPLEDLHYNTLLLKQWIEDLGAFDYFAQPNTWTKAQRANFIQVLSFSNTLTLNLSSSNNFVHYLTENTVLVPPINVVAGQSGILEFRQGSSPSIVGFDNFWRFKNGLSPNITLISNALDIITYTISSTGDYATCTHMGDIQ